MKRTAIFGLIGTLALAAWLTADEKKASVLLQAGQAKETIQGDLKGAIELYKNAVKEASTSRALAATALIRMAECYQKLGDAEARKIYEQVVRDYADQKDAATVARAKLGGAGSLRPAGDRPVWTENADGFGTVSPDGRFLTYTDWSAGAVLVLRDLAAGTDRRLTADGQVEYSAISKDGKQVAYEWAPKDRRWYELRVASLAGSGYLEPKVLVKSEEYKTVSPYDWSADGKSLAVFIQRQDNTGQIAVVSVPEGRVRVLKSVDWKGPTKIFFSPDGRYLAYDLKTGESARERHIFVIAVDGSAESVAVAHASLNTMMGWSPDGRWLLFASDRSGSVGLWGVRVANGKAEGFATLLRADIGSIWSVGTTAGGTLYTWKSTPVYVGVSPIDLNGGKAPASAGGPLQIFIGSRGRPEWSWDGKELAYSNCGILGGGPCTLLIRRMETGETRELEPRLQYFFFPRFSPDGRSFLSGGTDLKGRQAVYRIDTATGDAMPVGVTAGSFPQWTADGSGYYFLRNGTVVARNLATGAEREVFRGLSADARGFSVSPDGKRVAVIATGDPKASSSLMVSDAGGDTTRTLLRVNSPEQLRGDQVMNPAWTPDGRALLVAKVLPGDGRVSELWRVPVDGSQPRKLDVDIENWTGDGFRLSPDGRRIAFVATAGKQRLEIWALENFLPKTVASK